MILLIPFVAMAGDFFPQANQELEQNLFWAEASSKPESNAAVMNFRVWFKKPPAQVFKVLTDTAHFKQNMNNYDEARVLSKDLFKKIEDAKPQNAEEVMKLIGENRFSSDYNRDPEQNWTDYIFFKFKFPWPFTDRWSVQKARVDETNAAKGEYKYEYKISVGNFKTLFGAWYVLPVPNHPDWSEFRGTYESDAGVPVPKFIIKNATKTGFKKDIESYRKILGEK